MKIIVFADTPPCTYCGNNPVNHPLHFLTQTLQALRHRRKEKKGTRWRKLASYLEKKGTPLLFFVLRVLGIVRFKKEAEPLSDRSRVIWEEALARSFPIEQGFFFNQPTEEYRVHFGGRWHYFTSLPIRVREDVPLDEWIDSKAELKKYLGERGVRVPQGGRATTLGEAERIFDAIEKPVIVKPEIGSRGRHTLTHITTKDELRSAFRIAQKLCQFVVVEEHLWGSVYRATYVGGEIRGILRGDPPRITGDGVSTIDECIVLKNKTKHARQKDFKMTPSALAFLARQGYTPDTVLPEGVTIDLSEKIGLSYGGFAAEDFIYAHPKLRSELKKAGDTLPLSVVGFDFISEDITQDPDTVRWGIIEANTLPFIDLHHFPVEGEALNVAGAVWDAWCAAERV